MALEIERVKAEMEKMESSSGPIITDHPIDPELQTGESRLLGGAMQITAPYRKTEDTASD